MRRLRLSVALFLAFAAVGCSQAVNVDQVFDDVDFATYKTYAWMPRPEGDAGVPTGRQKYLEDALTKTIEQQLATKGFAKVSENPDVLVGYWYGLADEEPGSANFTVDYTKSYSNRAVWEGGGGVIRVDLVNPKTTRIVWRGRAEGAVNIDPTPDMVEKNVDRAVTKIFTQYPPKKPAG
jgi:hypothetical protein